MGSFCALTLNGYEIDQSKSYISTFWSCFFNEDDRRSRSVPYDLYYTQPITDNNNVPTFEYSASVDTMKLRLEIMGYTLDKVKLKYADGIEIALKSRQQYNAELFNTVENSDEKHLNILKNGGFEYWLKLIKYIFDNKITNFSDNLELHDDIYSFILDYNDVDEDLYLGYPNIGIGYFLRGALEAVEPRSELILDITSVVDSGYYKEDEPVCASTAQMYLDSTLPFQKIIILTEGSSDSKILSKALKLLYPKVYSYFSFLDFDTYKAEGGSAMLEKTVKSFAAAGISNKIIALFDYDAAGVAATERLKKRKFPSNFRVITLPAIELANNYPTIGPDGIIYENVNGRACSIEMYLGIDILTGANNTLVPVKWKNIEAQINTCQGEISRKAELQKKYLKKIRVAIANGSLQSDHDWTGLISVLDRIFVVASSIDHAPTYLNYR
ncbi:HEPN/Toprim-associated domain-containing protein [Nodularia spumigena CS-584]|nr:HEPN/Toprim-associated domain-containing protein [uncultured Flavobacterium sp.]MDB9381245.1 HEPN/Toprim-associated domain-containing protein [Nodularia spumigena CS-584]